MLSSAANWAQTLSFILPIVGTLFASLAALLQGRKNHSKINEIHVLVNSRLSKALEEIIDLKTQIRVSEKESQNESQ